ncbi:hypothetical protein CFP71_42215 [Amycolatopsis thailandensis]|uniref:Uncharacterized protein n=1 Tax=Amycolatopsis thailandensis TaxID=589330 RepID=A0A229R7Y2_9PSEU|nr:hypothetical protein [Amycolatopsis thailandensis]OXM42748.1 hypothetical protein CFP71_42215 [Amycolatopsis thailandensis]
MSNIDKLATEAMSFLGYSTRGKDHIIERAILRIQKAYREDHLDAAAIARLLGDDYPDGSPMRRTTFIQFVIERT